MLRRGYGVALLADRTTLHSECILASTLILLRAQGQAGALHYRVYEPLTNMGVDPAKTVEEHREVRATVQPHSPRFAYD